MENSKEDKHKPSNHQSTNAGAKFLWDGAIFALQINDNCLQLECVKSKKLGSLSSRNVSVQLDRIIAISCGSSHWKVDENWKPILDESFSNFLKFSSTQCFVLTIHTWDKLPDGKRKYRTMDLQIGNEEHCKNWRKTIELRVQDSLKKNDRTRPRNLLVFVNPYGGKKKGKKIHREIVSPLLKVAGIKETVIFTKREGQAKEYLTTNDLSSHDGVIAMGGDGTFNEIANGVLRSTQQKHGVSLDKENGEPFQKEICFKKPNIKLGIIPVGTANMLTYTTTGLTDPETATLQIIAGESQPLDVCSMHNEQGKLVTFFFLGCGNGVTEKILTMSEKFRYFGLFRYELSAINALLELSSSSCEITYLPGPNKNSEDFQADRTTCKNPCPVCQKTVKVEQDVKLPTQSHPKNDPLFEDKSKNESKECPPDDVSSKLEDWKVIQTPYVAITAFNTACKFKDNPNGFSQFTHLADGTCDLQINKAKSRMEFIRCYRAGMSKQGNFDFSCIEFHRVKAFYFRELESGEASAPSYSESRIDNSKNDKSAGDKEEFWTIDGELMKTGNGNIIVWVHSGLIDIFCTRD